MVWRTRRTKVKLSSLLLRVHLASTHSRELCRTICVCTSRECLLPRWWITFINTPTTTLLVNACMHAGLPVCVWLLSSCCAVARSRLWFDTMSLSRGGCFCCICCFCTCWSHIWVFLLCACWCRGSWVVVVMSSSIDRHLSCIHTALRSVRARAHTHRCRGRFSYWANLAMRIMRFCLVIRTQYGHV